MVRQCTTYTEHLEVEKHKQQNNYIPNMFILEGCRESHLLVVAAAWETKQHKTANPPNMFAKRSKVEKQQTNPTNMLLKTNLRKSSKPMFPTGSLKVQDGETTNQSTHLVHIRRLLLIPLVSCCSRMEGEANQNNESIHYAGQMSKVEKQHTNPPNMLLKL